MYRLYCFYIQLCKNKPRKSTLPHPTPPGAGRTTHSPPNPTPPRKRELTTPPTRKKGVALDPILILSIHRIVFVLVVEDRGQKER